MTPSTFKAAACALLLVSSSATGYEQATHAMLTKRAAALAGLNAANTFAAGSLGARLGLNALTSTGTSDYFLLADGTQPLSAFMHRTQLYEIEVLKDLNYSRAPLIPETWLMFGAIREDDNPKEDPSTPQDVTPGLLRPLHHFYDPYLNRGLDAPGVSVLDGDVHRNIDWAIGAFDSFEDPDLPEPQRKNHFTIFDAREAMFRALTLLTNNGSGYTDIARNVDVATKQTWRRTYWAGALSALGHVLHLNQDMAQPQHTRNEAHSGAGCIPGGAACLGGHTSTYEKYAKARTLGASSFTSQAPFNKTVPIETAPLAVAAHPVPAFASYSDYWSTSPGSATQPGLGLADYSNRGFFTAGKNFDSAEYPLPSRDLGRYTITRMPAPNWDGSPATDPTPVHVYFGEVQDAWQQTVASNVPLTTFSMWDQFVRAKLGTPAYSLNRLNYDAMADLLLPRAVAYSAGLINFFFRGQIDIDLPEEGVFAAADHAGDKGFTKVRARIRNKTPTFYDKSGSAVPQHMSGGQFFAVIRYHTDRKYEAGLDHVAGVTPCTDPAAMINVAKPDTSTDCRDGVEQIIVSRPYYGKSLAADEQALFEFEFDDSPIPFGITDVVLQIVYRGELGREADAVAVGTLDLSEPTYFAYHNASDYIHIGPHVYTRGQVEASATLLAQVEPQYCVDYRQTPATLVDGCLDPFTLDLAVSFGDIGNPLATISGLPNHRFIRLVYLTVSDEGFNPPAKSARRVPVPTAVARPHDPGSGKALLNQDGTCLPHDPFVLPPRHAQLWVVAPNQLYYQLSPLGSLRGVHGWFSATCVVNGDNATPGTPDDRASVMTPLLPFSEEVVPYPLNLMPAYL